MMNFPIFWQTLKGYWVTILIYSGALLLYSMFLTSFYPIAREVGTSYADIIEKIPEQLRQAFGGSDFFQGGVTFEAFLSLEHLNFFWVIAVSAFVIGFASRAIAGETEQGTIALLLSQPVTRTQVFVSKLVVGVLGIVALVWSAMGGIIWQAHRSDIAMAPLEGYYLFIGVAILFFISILSVSMMFSTMVAERGRAILMGLVFVIAAYVLDVFARLQEKWADLGYLSIFHYYGKPDAIITTASIDDYRLWVLVGSSVVATVVGLMIFNRRDISV